MADNRTGDEIIREVELGDNRSEELLEELVAEDMEIQSSDDHITYNENNEAVEAEKINSENEDDSAIVDEIPEEEVPVQKKQSKIFRILIGAIAVLSIILTIGIILYFTGFFDPEEKMEEKKVEKKVEEKIEKKDDVNFDNATIDQNKLNKKLTMLTKHEIMEKEALEAEEKRKEEEKKKKELEAQMKREEALKAKLEEEQKKKMQEEKLQEQAMQLEEAKKLIAEEKAELKAQQEEFIKLQEEQRALLEEQRLEILEQIKEATQKQDMEEKKQEEVKKVVTRMEEEPKEKMVEEVVVEEAKTMPNSFLPFINVATVNGKLYKSFLDKIESIEKNISLCRDNKNRIEVYFGPYDSNKERSKAFEKLMNNDFKDAYLIEFTQEEYDKRCKY